MNRVDQLDDLHCCYGQLYDNISRYTTALIKSNKEGQILIAAPHIAALSTAASSLILWAKEILRITQPAVALGFLKSVQIY